MSNELEHIQNVILNSGQLAGESLQAMGQGTDHLAEGWDVLAHMNAGTNSPELHSIAEDLRAIHGAAREVTEQLPQFTHLLNVYLGSVGLSEMEQMSPVPLKELRERPADTAAEAAPANSQEQAPLGPREKALLRQARQKIYFFKKKFVQGDSLANDEQRAMIANLAQINSNAQEQLEEGSPFRALMDEYLTAPTAPDPFATQAAAEAMADAILDGTHSLDMVDLTASIDAYNAVGATLFEEKPSLTDAQLDRVNALHSAMQGILVQRVDTDKLMSAEEANLLDLYDRTFSDLQTPGWNNLMHEALDSYQRKVIDRAATGDFILNGGLYSREKPLPGYPQTSYARPMDQQELDKLNKAAADTMESTHLLKTYGVSPMVVPANTVDLPWDIAILPPIKQNGDAYEEGAVADFIFLPPDDGRGQALVRKDQDPDNPLVSRVTVGNSAAVQRFRLHDNGQVTNGHLYHNNPSDITEEQFTQLGAGNAFARLRGLFVALAFDAIVPEDVVHDKVGGSVTSQYKAAESRHPQREPVTELLLRRRRELKRSGVSDHSRQPRDWELPRQDIGGYIKRLPEGAKARPEAEEEAREYYEGMGHEFQGLPEGKTFTKPYKRGTGPARTVFRRASFRPSSATRKFMDGQ